MDVVVAILPRWHVVVVVRKMKVRQKGSKARIPHVSRNIAWAKYRVSWPVVNEKRSWLYTKAEKHAEHNREFIFRRCKIRILKKLILLLKKRNTNTYLQFACQFVSITIWFITTSSKNLWKNHIGVSSPETAEVMPVGSVHSSNDGRRESRLKIVREYPRGKVFVSSVMMPVFCWACCWRTLGIFRGAAPSLSSSGSSGSPGSLSSTSGLSGSPGSLSLSGAAPLRSKSSSPLSLSSQILYSLSPSLS